MTNEEAIKLLSQIRDALLASNSWLPSTKNPIKESFGIAINALNASSADGDTISRQAAIDALNVGAELLGRILDDAVIFGDERAKYKWGLGLIESCISDMKKLPSEQPQRTGRWELIDDTEFRVPGYRCSVCHCECEDWGKKPTYRFCPNCGARMEGE